MNLFQWLNDNRLIIIVILSIALVISIIFNILSAPKTPSKEESKSLTFSDIISSPNWAWIWPTLIGFIVGGIAIYNLRTIIDPYSNSSISSDICSVIPGTNSSVSRIPSLYFANISFFFAYLFLNALSNYNIVSDKNVDISLVNNRKYRSAATMAILLIVFLSIIILRYNTSHCDSIVGLLVTVSTFTALGLLWYKIAEFCGAKATDLMGISQNIVSSKAKAPVVCKRNPTST
jgi:hypothetical protein